MLLIDTITQQDMDDIQQSKPIGIFKYLGEENDEWFSLLFNMSVEYYFNKSTRKQITSTYENLISKGLDADRIIANIIRGKFKFKWNKIYNALITSQYDATSNLSYDETKNGNNIEKIEYNSSNSKSGSNMDTMVYGSKEDTTTKKGFKDVTIRSTDNENGVYGYNTDYAVGDDVGTELTNEINIGDINDNKTVTDIMRGGSDETTHQFGEINSHDGDDKTTNTIDESKNVNGRNISASELIKKELDLQNSTTFTDIVLKDVDTILCLSIY